MISDLSLAVCDSPLPPIVPQGTEFGILASGSLPLQPVHNVQQYLENRTKQPHWKGEEALLATLFKDVRSEVKMLVAACELVQTLAKTMSVQSACNTAIRTFKDQNWNLNTFRQKYDAWAKAKDWVVLVNKSKAPVAWRTVEANLPEAFLRYVEKQFAGHRRDDAKREAWRSIRRHWRCGKNDAGQSFAIPGYEVLADGTQWDNRIAALYPVGWSYENIRDRIQTRGKFTKAVEALSHESISTARASLPHVHGTRAKLRFLERVQFDDVKTDFRVFDPETGEVMDLWLLIAHDVATGVLLGFGMRPARAREDGSQEHLTLRDMKQLCGWLLERYGLPPYTMHWVFECGTATITQGTKLALEEFLGGRIIAHFTQMIGGKSPVGYRETGKGNSGSKGSLESGNRLIHIIGSTLPGQTGRHYGKRPADLAAREKECKITWRLAQDLPEHLRAECEYPLLTIQQARVELRRIIRIRNSRTDHHMEGFERVLQWFNPADGQWHPQQTAPHPLPEGARVEPIMESPDQRALRLALPYRDQWSGVSPEVIVEFYERKPEAIRVEDSGEIKFRYEGNDVYFVAPSAELKLAPGTSGIGYFHPDDPALLHITNGKGLILGTWLRRSLVKDEATLSAALRYTATALKAAKEFAAQLASEETEQLEAMRARNAELMQFRTFTGTALETRNQKPETQNAVIGSPVATGFAAIRTNKRKAKTREQQLQNLEGDSSDLL